MESFVATLKKAICGRRSTTREEAKLVKLEYVLTWFNPYRIHSNLGMSPLEFEKRLVNW